MVAAGAYLRALREEQHLSRAEVAAAVGTHESQLVRIEAGQQDTRGSLLLGIVAFLRGKADHVQQLLVDTNATADDARQLAKEWLGRDATYLLPEPQKAQVREMVAQYGKDRVEQVLDQLESLDPDELVDVLIRLQTRKR